MIQIIPIRALNMVNAGVIPHPLNPIGNITVHLVRHGNINDRVLTY